ncbi:MAG: peptidoglycan glycosyltransferase [Fluviicola sp. XM-24bin1]|nr:MAG: peptidoglycan glycosyltransferase [Fluviicola sp. XM-24bin1]
MSEKKDIFLRAYIVYFGFVVLLLVVLFQTINIQLQDGRSDQLTEGDGEERLATKTVQKEARRGQILDVNGTPLVTSVSYFDIYMDPTVVSQEVFASELNDLCIGLNKLYPDKTASEYQRMIREARARESKYLSIRKKVTNEERKKIRELPIFNLGRFKGGIIDNVENIERKLPHGELLARTLGKLDQDGIPKYGLELSCNGYLTGEPGEEVERKLATGWKKIGLVTKEPVDGADIVTTFDMTIQDVAHTELMNQLESQQAEKGCVIVMDVKTGYVKAMVNLHRDSDGGYSEKHYNQAIGTKEVPGSTFKLASLMALLEDKKVRLSDQVNAKGYYTFYDKTFKDSNPYGYGEISIQRAFEKSSNVFTEIINKAYRNNPSQFIRRLKSFGLASKLDISIEGEKKPTLYEPGDAGWSGLSLPSMAIGYEVQQTPLQTLAFYNAVANNGKFMRPQFIKEINRGNERVKTFKPEVIIDQVCSKRTLKDLQKCLKGVMLRGTGESINSANFSIAGKTGTARILDDKTTIVDDKKYQASFVGYFPAEDPIYSCIVVVSAPSQSIYGAVVSGSVFNAIANKVYASALKYHKPVNIGRPKKKALPISKDGYARDLAQSYRMLGVPYVQAEESDWVFTRSREPKVVMERRYAGENTVPNVVGMTARDAVYLIERAGMKAMVEGYGVVKSQSLQAGSPSERGRRMKITLK